MYEKQKYTRIMQGKLGKVACKASTQIGSCAWRLMGRQPANKSRSLHPNHQLVDLLMI